MLIDLYHCHFISYVLIYEMTSRRLFFIYCLLPEAIMVFLLSPFSLLIYFHTASLLMMSAFLRISHIYFRFIGLARAAYYPTIYSHRLTESQFHLSIEI